MGKDEMICPKCGEVLTFRLGGYECPSCDYEMRSKDAPPPGVYSVDPSRLETLLRGMPPTRELGNPEPIRRRSR